MKDSDLPIDEQLVRRVMGLYGLSSPSEAIDFALRQVAGDGSRSGLLALEGTGWEGDLGEMRRDT